MRLDTRFVLFVPLIVLACATTPRVDAPPEATAVRTVDTLPFGAMLPDDYRWLREKENPGVRAYVEAENAYTAAQTERLGGLKSSLYDQMVARLKEDDESVPVFHGGYYYYSRNVAGQEYPLYCRRAGSMDADEEIILDINELAEGYEYYRLGGRSLSPDHTRLIYTADTSGGEIYTAYVKNLTTGETYSDRIENVSDALFATNDLIYYETYDSTRRPDKVWRYTLGTDQSDAEMVYHEPDGQIWSGVSRSRDDKIIFIGAGNYDASQVYFAAADDPNAKFRLIEPMQAGLEYSVDHHNGTFYIVTNDNAINFRIVTAPLSDPSRANWTELIAESKEIYYTDILCFVNHLVVTGRTGGFANAFISSYDGLEMKPIELMDVIHRFGLEDNAEYNTDLLRFSYENPITPRSIYDYNMSTGDMTLKKQDPVPNYDPANYRLELLWATADDGSRIPITLSYHKNVDPRGNNPLHISGYGAYGIPTEPSFSRSRTVVMDYGVLVARAGIRGGSDMGRQWYLNGKLMNKRNTFTDFFACVEHLIAEGYTSPEKVSAYGGSAGGLVTGYAAAERPDLFGIVTLDVPFVDLMNTMLDATIPLTELEYVEWGNPNEQKFFEYMLSYSPYDNLGAGPMPNMLIMAGWNDPRVQYWEAAKFTARARDSVTNDAQILLSINMGAGHGGASGRYAFIDEIAFMYSIIIDAIGGERIASN